MPCRSASAESIVLFFRLVVLFITSHNEELCRQIDQLKSFIFLLFTNKCTNFASSTKGIVSGIKGLLPRAYVVRNGTRLNPLKGLSRFLLARSKSNHHYDK